MCPVCLGDLCKYILELELEMLRLGPTRAVCMYVSMYWYVCMYVLVCTGMYRIIPHTHLPVHIGLGLGLGLIPCGCDGISFSYFLCKCQVSSV